VVTWNVMHGRSPADGRVDLDRFGDAVASLDADVLALQEVDRAQPRSHEADLAAIAAEAMGAVDHRFVAALRGTPGDWVPAGAEDPVDAPVYGIALLSRRPVSRWQMSRLPRVRVPAPAWFGDGVLPTWVREEPRVAVAAVVEGPAAPVTVATTHLSFVPWWNGHQLRVLVRSLRRHTHPPRVLVGDLNMGRPRAGRISGMTPLVRGTTFPAEAPREQLDHVLADPGLRARTAEDRQLALSDHRALVVELG
jgi:endonuclease/exonuclease/phosphatase family metal-dependent hydrolase